MLMYKGSQDTSHSPPYLGPLAIFLSLPLQNQGPHTCGVALRPPWAWNSTPLKAAFF